MDVRDVLSGIGSSLAALVLAGLGLKAVAKKRQGELLKDARLTAYSRFSTAVGCAALAASFFLSAHSRLSVLLLLPAATGMVLSVVMDNVRRRRVGRD